LQEWLHEAWVAHGLVPFLAALVVAELFNRLRLSGLAITAGIATAVYLGARAAFNTTPATHDQRMVVLVLAAAVLGLVLDLAPKARRPVAALIALAAPVAVIWTTWPTVTLENWLAVIAPAGLGMLYAAWTAGTLTLLADAPERAGALGVGLGGAVGACAMLAGSTFGATLGYAAAAASGAYLLIQILSNERLSCGTVLTLPLAVVCGLVPPANVLMAGLSWYLLPILAVVSALALIPLSERLQVRVRALLCLAICAAAGAGAGALAWMVIGAPVT